MHNSKSSSPLTNTKKPHLFYGVYKTNNRTQRSPPPKAISAATSRSLAAGNAPWEESEVLYINDRLLKPRRHRTRHTVPRSPTPPPSREISTQTSKTIVQLAEMESFHGPPRSEGGGDEEEEEERVEEVVEEDEAEGGHISADSLGDGGSPRPSSLDNEPYSIAERNSPSDVVSDFLRKQYAQGVAGAGSEAGGVDHEEVARADRSRSFVETHYHHPNFIVEAEVVAAPAPAQQQPSAALKPPSVKLQRRSSKSLNLPDNSAKFRASSSIFYVPNGTYMCSTAATRNKSRREEVLNTTDLIPAMRRGRSTSPKPTTDQRKFETSRKIPYIDQSKSDVSSATTIVNTARNPEIMKQLEEAKQFGVIKQPSEVLTVLSSSKDDVKPGADWSISAALFKFRDEDWQVALKGLSELVELCRVVEVEEVYDYMTAINQRLIETLKSPRSHVCRTACQAAGHLFEYVKDTRKPEFDDIVDLLLFKTADANKFIRQDANLALDCMVTHISTFNAVRALCAKGPFHKNNLVRCATIRLLVCATVIAGTDFVLNISNNDFTRKRLIVNMVRFLEDKNLETRKFAERLYKILSKDVRFDQYLKKFIEKDQILKIRKTLKLVHKK